LCFVRGPIVGDEAGVLTYELEWGMGVLPLFLSLTKTSCATRPVMSGIMSICSTVRGVSL